jgi:hypothetical protein
MRIPAVLFAVLAMLGACRNSDSVVASGSHDTTTDKIPSSQIVLVEHEYENYAWGYQHRGTVVFADGSVVAYAWDRDEKPYESSGSTTISIAELSAKYDHGRHRVGSVGADTVALIERLSAAAAHGDLTERAMTGADMGETTRTAYLFDETAEKYTPVVLRVDGDWSYRNTSSQAAQLAELVDAIAERYR